VVLVKMVLNQPLLVSKNNEAVLYRLGSISIEEIERIGTIQIRNNRKLPGMLSRHYAPKTKTILVDDAELELKKYQMQSWSLSISRYYNQFTTCCDQVL
jgi:hypothetical protein